MTSEQDPARSFGAVAAAYERGRPGYPREAVSWLVGDEPQTVLELGAGTGKLTRELVAAGHDVHATDPDEAMLEVLREQLPGVRTSLAPAEDLQVPDRSVDVVVCAQAFHWFDLERALPQIARVLKPTGHLALVWNLRDERIPWVKRLGRLIGDPVTQAMDQNRPLEALAHSPLFSFVEETTFKSWQEVNRETIVDLVASRSNVATLEPEARQAKLEAVLAFYDDFGRGMDGMQLPYVVHCRRTQVVHQPGLFGEERAADPEGPADAADPTRAGDPHGKGTDGKGPDILLIDFR